VSGISNRAKGGVVENSEPRLSWEGEPEGALLDWALKHDPETARIILAVQAKVAPRPSEYHQDIVTTGVNSEDNDLGRPVSPSESVTILSGLETPTPDGRSRRRKYVNRAEQQRAYRGRKQVAYEKENALNG
jgi:hypothetical protein